MPAAASTESYSAPLGTAIGDLRRAGEVRDGYDRALFGHWVDADGDGCDTRDEVLIAESRDPVTVGAPAPSAAVAGSPTTDRRTWTDRGRIDIDHLVPLAEAWDSGARTWTARTGERYANDLGDGRTFPGAGSGPVLPRPVAGAPARAPRLLASSP